MQAKAIGKTIGSKLLVAVLAVALVFTMMPLCGSAYAEQTSWNEDDVALKIGTTELKRADVTALESIEKTVTVGSTEQTVKGVKLETLFNKYSDYFTKPKVTINTVDIGETPNENTRLVAEWANIKDYILGYEIDNTPIFQKSKSMDVYGCFNLYDPQNMLSSDGTKLKAVLKMPGEFIDGGSGSGGGQGGGGEADLTVKYGETSKNFFFDEEQGKLYTKNSGQKVYIDNYVSADAPLTYSAMNNMGIADNATGVYGPKLEEIIKAAGIVTSAFDLQKVTLIGNDETSREFAWGDLFKTDRYTFPKADRATSDNGAAVAAGELEDQEKVPTLLNLAAKQICFGQVSPNERTKPSFCKNMLGEAKVVPQILIEDVTEFGTYPNQSSPSIASGSGVEIGDVIDLGTINKNGGTVYYTTDGTEPTQQSAIYNWKTKDGALYNPPKVEKDGEFIIKTKAFGFLNQPSETKTFTYIIPYDLAKVGTMTLSKSKVTAGAAAPVVTVVAEGKTLKVNTDYTLSVGNTKKVGTISAKVTGKVLYKGTLTKSFKVIPAKAKINKAIAGKKKVTVMIKSQKASGVTKYQIKYKLKTAKKWKTTTTKSTKKVIKKLKKGKKYNIKVRAYGKTGYGAYSAVKTVKIK